MASETTQLQLATPTQGTLSGTWGDTVNNAITEYVNIAIAGTLTLTGDGAVTLANTLGNNAATNIASTTAQFAIIKVTGTLTTTKVITAPSYSKMYVVDNAATGGVVTFKAAAQTGVSVAVGEKCTVYFNGTDYVKVASSTATGDVVGPASATDNAITRFDLTTGKLIQNSLVTVADDGAFLAPVVGSIIPFYFNSTLPAAGPNHGAVAHLHATGKLYYAHNSAWQIVTSGLGTADTVGTVTPVGSAGQLLSNDGAGGLTSNTTGTGILTALGINVGSAGAPVVFNGALGTPSSGTATNLTGLPLTTGVTGTLPIANGGTGTTSTTFANLTTNVTGTLPVTNGGTGIATTTAYSVVFAGTTATGAFQAAAGPGTATHVLTSNGTGALPTFQAVPASAPGNLTGAVTSVGLATSLGSFTSANLLAALTDETGTGSNVFATSPTLVTPLLGTPTSGVLSACTVDGTDAVGFRNIPQNSQSTAYTLVLADSGKHIFHPVGDNNVRTFTIPANSSVAYPIGTALTFINMAVAVVSIAITTDTLTLSSAGTTGTRSLAQYGSATCIKITSTSWLISGSGLT